jgi:hypothetical protein
MTNYSGFGIFSDFGFRHSDFSSNLAAHSRAKKDPADAHQRGQFHETHGLERLLLIVGQCRPE